MRHLNLTTIFPNHQTTKQPRLNVAQSNPWYWGSLTRQQFESTLQRDAVLLRQRDEPKPDKKAFIAKKVDIEAVKARKNALIAKGVIKPTVDIAAVRARKNAAAGIK